jgi:hypothetical protein
MSAVKERKKKNWDFVLGNSGQLKRIRESRKWSLDSGMEREQ